MTTRTRGLAPVPNEVRTTTCTLTLRDVGLSGSGPCSGRRRAPVRIEYRMSGRRAPAYHGRHCATFGVRQPRTDRTRASTAKSTGASTAGGPALKGLHGRGSLCCSRPPTLSDPRSGLRTGGSQDPGRLGPVPGAQPWSKGRPDVYTRLDEFTYRYAIGTFESELTWTTMGLVPT